MTTWCRAGGSGGSGGGDGQEEGDGGWGPLAAESNCLPSCQEGRIVVTEHAGGLAVVNVYVPNAGDRGPDGSGGARLEHKLTFLHELHAKLLALEAAGRRVVAIGDFNVPPADADQCDAWGTLEASYDAREIAAMRGEDSAVRACAPKLRCCLSPVLATYALDTNHPHAHNDAHYGNALCSAHRRLPRRVAAPAPRGPRQVHRLGHEDERAPLQPRLPHRPRARVQGSAAQDHGLRDQI